MYATARAFVRSLALRIPPLRRLFDSVSALRTQNAQLIDTVDRLRASNAAMGAQLIEQSTEIATAGQYNSQKVDDGVASALRSERDRAREKAAAAYGEMARIAQSLAHAEAKLLSATAELDIAQAEVTAHRSDAETAATRNQLLAGLLEASEARAERGAAEKHAINARLLELEDAIRAAYEAVATAQQERDAARAELDKVNLQLRVSNAENMARLLGKLSFVEYSMRQTDGAGGNSTASTDAAAGLYLDLLEASLTGMLEQDGSQSPWTASGFDAENRMLGRDWPERALTMIGVVRMRNLRRVVETIIAEQIPGDFIETGVWRGGACIYMSGILAARDERERRVWVADSFEGLPPPSPELYPEDAGDIHSSYQELAISEQSVRGNFQRYGLLSERVRFLKGWFKDTLPSAPIQQIALLRLDGDMYESTIQALDALYDKVAPGGFVIVDDYGLDGCRKAIEDFRSRHNITDAIEDVDGAAVFWRKTIGAGAGVVKMSDKRRSEQPN